MTPEEFAAKMREIYPEDDSYDTELAHGNAEELMCEVLESLGYGEGCKIFAGAEKWYA